MLKTQDIHPLTDFARNTKRYAQKLRRTGRPVILTVNGHAEFVVQSAKLYQRLLDRAERQDSLDLLEDALAEVDRGEYRGVEETFAELKTKYLGKKPDGL